VVVVARKVRGQVAVVAVDQDMALRSVDRNVAVRSVEVRVQDREEVAVGRNAEGRHSAGRVRHSETVRNIAIVRVLEPTVNSAIARNLANARVAEAVDGVSVRVEATGRMAIVAARVVRVRKAAEAADRKAVVVAVRNAEARRKVAVNAHGAAEVAVVSVAGGDKVPAAAASAEAVVHARNVADPEARQVVVATVAEAAKITIRNNRRRTPVVKVANPFADR
jgi:hypothetical protein